MTKEELQNLINLIKGNEKMRLSAFYIILNLHHNAYAKLAKAYTYNQYFGLWQSRVYVFKIPKTKSQFLAENKDTIDKMMKS